jgi:type I restriction enzyme R subunit
MGHQSEATLEANLLQQLEKLGYEPVTIKDDKALEANLKSQIEKQNNLTLNDKEFRQGLPLVQVELKRRGLELSLF